VIVVNLGELVVIGSGGHSRVVVDTASAAGYKLIGIIDINYKGKKETILNTPVIGGLLTLDELNPKHVSVFVAIGDNSKRAEQFYKAQAKGFSTPSVIHPTAFISEHAIIGNGTIVNAASIINSEAVIGENCIINSGAIVEHEVIIGNHCHLCPGVNIGGRVTIGNESFIGIGARVIDNIHIGIKSVVGAGSVIIKDVDSHATVVGISGARIK